MKWLSSRAEGSRFVLLVRHGRLGVTWVTALYRDVEFG